jgi:hypothetical protein
LFVNEEDGCLFADIALEREESERFHLSQKEMLMFRGRKCTQRNNIASATMYLVENQNKMLREIQPLYSHSKMLSAGKLKSINEKPISEPHFEIIEERYRECNLHSCVIEPSHKFREQNTQSRSNDVVHA